MKHSLTIKITGSVTLLLAVSALLAADQPENFAGFTRPGWPSDQISGNKVIFAADNPDLRDMAMGGTIYFTVLERSDKAGDTWESGLEQFNAAFKTGIDFNGMSSPALDTTAKYLYLYQVVNDRKIPAPILSVSVKLIVEPSEITSWGHFHGAGFAIQTKADKDQAGEQLRPVSFNNVVSGSPLDRAYAKKADEHAAPNPLQLVWVPTKLGQDAPKAKDDKRVLRVMWDALDPALDADHVMLLPQSDFNQKPCFRAVWNPANPVKKDVRSTVFGFTSNLPPTFDLVRLRGLRKVTPPGVKVAVETGRRLEDIGLFLDDFQGMQAPEGLVGAEGKVPTPLPDHPRQEEGNAPANYLSPGPFLPRMSPGMPGGGSPGGGGGSPGGFSPPGVSGGGGGGGSSGGGQRQAQAAQQTGSQTQTITISNTLTNAQAQAQTQLQTQFQSQRQSQNNGQHRPSGHGGLPHEVVPQPAALLLAAIGLPVLVLLARRRGRQASCGSVI